MDGRAKLAKEAIALPTASYRSWQEHVAWYGMSRAVCIPKPGNKVKQ